MTSPLLSKMRAVVEGDSMDQLEDALALVEKYIRDEAIESGALTPQGIERAGLWARAISDELAWRKLEWIGP